MVAEWVGRVPEGVTGPVHPCWVTNSLGAIGTMDLQDSLSSESLCISRFHIPFYLNAVGAHSLLVGANLTSLLRLP